MNSLIIFDSNYGNTERLARAVAETLAAAGKSQVVKATSAKTADLKDIDLLVLASPTVQWNVLPAMQAFIGKLSGEILKGKSVACFDTIMRGPRFIMKPAAAVVAEKLQNLGAVLASPAMDFYVTTREGPLAKGELERAQAWAKSLVK